MKRAKAISVLGSTGSIGRNTLKVAEHLGDIRVVAMAAGRNTGKFVEQIKRFSPELVACGDEACAELLERETAKLDKRPRIECGEAGLVAVATHAEADTVVSATVGAVGFIPTLRAIEAGKRIALANKETLVMAGELMTAAARRSGAEIVPVDSEHNAIHQCSRRTNFGSSASYLNGFGRPVSHLGEREDPICDTRTGPRSPELEDGREDHDRLRNPYE